MTAEEQPRATIIEDLRAQDTATLYESGAHATMTQNIRMELLGLDDLFSG